MKLSTLIITALLALVLTGCAGFSDNTKQGLYMAGTVRLMEKGHVTPAEVINKVELVRGLAAEADSHNYGELRLRAADLAGFGDLPHSSQILLITLLDDLELDFALTPDSPLSPELREAIALRLRWMVQAATLYGG